MRDAARQLADALQPLRLAEPLLELLAFLLGVPPLGDVGGDRADAADLPVGVEERELHEHELALGLAVAAGDREMALVGPGGRQHLAVEILGRSDPRRRQHLGRRAPDRGGRADFGELLPAAVDEHEAQVGVLDDDQRRRVVDHGLQALLALAPLGLGAAALAEVDQLDEEVERPFAVAVHQRDVRQHVQDTAVGVHHALLERVAAAAPGEQLAHERLVELDVLGVVEGVQAGGAHLGLGAAEDLGDRAVQAQPATLEVDQRHPDRRVVEGAAEELLGVAQRVLDAARLGHVLTGAVDDAREAVAVELDLAARMDHARVAVGADDPVVDVEIAPLADRDLHDARDARAVVGMDVLEVLRVAALGLPPAAGRGCGTARPTR